MKNMQQKIDLPKEYVPFEEVLLCSNTLRKVKIPFLVNNTPIFLIGRGILPQIWISAPTDPELKNWGYIVERNFSKNPIVSVIIDETDKSVKIRIKDILVLNSKIVTDDKVIIDTLDLRPFGFKIFGDTGSFTIGGSKFLKSNFNGMAIAFAMGEKDVQ